MKGAIAEPPPGGHSDAAGQIPAEARQRIATGLGQVLADTSVLYGKTHGFHWNVTGPMFNTLHLMFMDQYTELWTALDGIAERIRALGLPTTWCSTGWSWGAAPCASTIPPSSARCSRPSASPWRRRRPSSVS